MHAAASGWERSTGRSCAWPASPFRARHRVWERTRDLSRRLGRYACVAATSEFERSETSVGGLLGYPYRAQVDFDSGRFALCKISGRPDPTPDPRVTTPGACGG